MKGQTIVCLSTTDWDAPQYGSRQQIMKRFAEENRVLFVEAPRGLHSLISDPVGTRRQMGRWLKGQLRQIAPSLVALAVPPVLPVFYHPLPNAVNQRILVAAVRRACRELGWKPTIVWTYWPNSRLFVRALKAELSVYHCIDDFSRVPYPLVRSSWIEADEERLASAVDVVLVRTDEQRVRLRKHNEHTHLIRGGVDYEVFSNENNEPDEAVKAYAPPRVGWVGTLDDRIDEPVVYECAKNLPDVSWILVGPIKRHRVNLDRILRLPNVHHLGPCAPERVPSMVAALDVCLIPYRVSRTTEGVSPLKLYEYLAAGKPVVATPLPYVLLERDVIDLVSTASECVEAIRSLLNHPGDNELVSKRRQRAKAHSWTKVVSLIETILDRYLISSELE